jgi:hypothetical protein
VGAAMDMLLVVKDKNYTLGALIYITKRITPSVEILPPLRSLKT